MGFRRRSLYIVAEGEASYSISNKCLNLRTIGLFTYSTVESANGNQQTERAMPKGDSNYLRNHYQGYLNRLLIDAAIGYAIFVIDTDHKIVGWNKGASRLLGYEQEEILGKDFSIIFTPEDIAAGADKLEIQEAATSGQAEDERWHVKKDGTRFYVSGFLFPLRDEAERIEGFAKIMRDFTERRLAEDALRRANHELKLRIEEEAARRSAEMALGHALADFQMLMNSITDYAIVLLAKRARSSIGILGRNAS